jgi:hypothetical protein
LRQPCAVGDLFNQFGFIHGVTPVFKDLKGRICRSAVAGFGFQAA